MTFIEFKDNLIAALKKSLSNTVLADAELTHQSVEKLNGSYNALCVRPANSIIGMNLNLDSLYSAYNSCPDADFAMLVEKTTEECIKGIQESPSVNINDLTDYSKVKDKLSLEVVSAERNAEALKSIPHNNIEDMAVITRIIIDKNDFGNATVVITDSLCQKFGITKEQLFADALESAPIIRPSEIKGMTEVLSEMLSSDLMPDILPEDEQIFVATVPDKSHGAGVIAYPNFMEDAAKKLGGSFFILPSSIHEILLVRDNGKMTVSELENMVKEVNSTQVELADQLTDSVYYYDSEKHLFELAEKALKSA